jgi:IS5 family transposase
MRRFAGIELLEDAAPDESTIVRFRHLLEQHRLSEQILGAAGVQASAAQERHDHGCDDY